MPPTHDGAPIPTTLRIRFAAGERPHCFWVSTGSRQRASPDAPARYKVLSKRRPDRSLLALVVEEDPSGVRRGMLRLEVPADAPSGWLAHLVGRLADDLGTRFRRFDLEAVKSAEEWRATARRLGWLEAG